MNELQIQEQVQALRDALEKAKASLLQQQELINKLTAPPFIYATVVAVSRSQSKIEGPQRSEYDGLRVNRSLTTLEGLHVGDEVGVKDMNHIRRDIRQAKKLVIVGFTHDQRVITQIDGQWVVADPVPIFRQFYKIIKSAAGDAAVLIVDGKFVEVLLPSDKEINPGDTVKVIAESMQIVDVASVQVGGNIGYLRRVIDEKFSEVDYESSVRVVFNGKYGSALDKGDRVVLDGTGIVIIRNLGKNDERFRFTAETNVTWDDIGGLAEAKRQMIEAIELPHQHPEIFRFYGKRPIKGILLYGPPGNGKTMLAKAAATSLAHIYNGGSTSTGFIYIKGPEILDRFVGVAEATIRQIFQQARKHKEAHGYPAVVFIDEADAILAKRGTGISSDIERTIVPMFLTEMDGLEDSGALVILATNRSDILDPAIVRDGRIDRKIKITRPTPESTAEIFQLNLKQVPLKNGYTRQELAKLGAEELFSPRRSLYQVKTGHNGTLNFTLGHIVNGGMVVSIVDQATSFAVRRDLGQKKQQGLCRDDLVAAVNAVEQQNRDLNHSDELAEFVRDFREDVMGIQRLRQATA